MATPAGALLCESCGYPIDGLPESGHCPECGRTIVSSLPPARRGSPWQQRPSVRSLLATDLLAIRRPSSLFESIIVDRRCATSLLLIHLLLAATIVVAPWSGTLIGDPARTARLAHRAVFATALWAIPLQIIVITSALLALTLIEWIGIQYWSRRRGHRLTPAAAWQICAHASVGWILFAAFAFLGLIIDLNLSIFGLANILSRYPLISHSLLVIIPAVGAFIGLLTFEILVYSGVNRCRFATPPKSED